MKTTEYTFQPELINLLSTILDSKGLRSVYNLIPSAKYSIDYIVDVIIAVSQKTYTRYRIHNDLANLFKESSYSKYSRTSLKSFVKKFLSSQTDNSFFNTYVIIGHDVPVTINELTVKLNFIKQN
jgi:hypothetical protein